MLLGIDTKIPIISAQFTKNLTFFENAMDIRKRLCKSTKNISRILGYATRVVPPQTKDSSKCTEFNSYKHVTVMHHTPLTDNSQHPGTPSLTLGKSHGLLNQGKYALSTSKWQTPLAFVAWSTWALVKK